ncbi:hypothetical protein SAMN04488570_1387 [Nocardioides scoriae]|uniref:Uncharacterized protein n=1 Tax=Nocardioides scoriae TaxID=642780 RepID=A0A1H1QDQ1_9ACTN|nr:hypothetical protein [Nocardioides scoriae]SDS21570.1 hypothetical protein SAMN04488570_1387 [Nocardioides scoriae]
MTRPVTPHATRALPPAVVAGLRAEVRRFVTEAGTRRLVPATCRVGRPGGASLLLPGPGSDADAGLRADLVERALDGLEDARGALAWVARSGPLLAGDEELAWHAAARAGFGRHGLEVAAFVVLNRHGWVDLVGGDQRRWSRVRAAPR